MTPNSTKPRDKGFTMVANYFFDKVMPQVSGAEWKIICAVIRDTVGWGKDEAEITFDRFMILTGYARQAVAVAIENVLHYRVVQRRSKRVGKQLTFQYRAVPKANLKAVPKRAPKMPQSELPFSVSEFENQTAISEFENQTPSRYENQTPIEPVLSCIKEIRSKEINTHTQSASPVENIAARQRVCGSKFTRKQIKEYAYASHDFCQLVNAYWDARGKKQNRIDGVRNPVGFTTVALRSGEHDEDIQDWLDDPGMFDFEQFRQVNSGSNF